MIFKEPKVEIAPITAGVIGTYVEMTLDKRHKDAFALTPTLGSTEVMPDGNGDPVESYSTNTTYVSTLKMLEQSEEIECRGGNAVSEYALRVTDRRTNKGYLLARNRVQEGVTIDTGGQSTGYTFTSMKPSDGSEVIIPYEAPKS